MSDRIQAALSAAVLVIALILIGTAGSSADSAARIVPQCQEDEVIVGEGDFTAGRWSGYRCGPALDDLEVMP